MGPVSWSPWSVLQFANLHEGTGLHGFTAPPFSFAGRKVQKLQHAIEEATAAPW